MSGFYLHNIQKEPEVKLDPFGPARNVLRFAAPFGPDLLKHPPGSKSINS